MHKINNVEYDTSGLSAHTEYFNKKYKIILTIDTCML